MKNSQSPAPNVPMNPVAAVRPTRIFHVLASVSARRLRGLSLLASLALVVVVVLLAAFSVLIWWSVPVVVALLAADIAWLRHRALSERAAREANPSRGEANPSRRGSAIGPARSDTSRSPEPDHEAEPDPEAELASESRRRVEPEPAVEPVVGAPMMGAAVIAESPEVPAEQDPSSWAPVPVPPPTYTLKAKAVPPVSETVSEPVAESAPAQPTSLDGLVYDYDLDELVERRQEPGPEKSARAV